MRCTARSLARVARVRLRLAFASTTNGIVSCGFEHRAVSLAVRRRKCGDIMRVPRPFKSTSMKPRLSAIVLSLASLVCASSCSSMYYGVRETFGSHKRDILVQR